jgi:hypothetical protein
LEHNIKIIESFGIGKKSMWRGKFIFFLNGKKNEKYFGRKIGFFS